MTEEEQGYYTVGQAARVLGYRRQTVGNLIRDGKLHGQRLSDKAQYRIPASEVNQLLANIQQKGNRYKGVRLFKKQSREMEDSPMTEPKKQETNAGAAPAVPAAKPAPPAPPAQKTRVIIQARKKAPPPKAKPPAAASALPVQPAPPPADSGTIPETKKEDIKHVENTDNAWWF